MISIVIALVVIYKTDSTLPWWVEMLAALIICIQKSDWGTMIRWGFLIACILSFISILFFGALSAITGLSFIIQPFIQMIGGFLHPGKVRNITIREVNISLNIAWSPWPTCTLSCSVTVRPVVVYFPDISSPYRSTRLRHTSYSTA